MSWPEAFCFVGVAWAAAYVITRINFRVKFRHGEEE